RNRAKVLAAAAATFEQHGPDASLEEIAHRAEVGIGTLYRHFPTRDDLIRTLYDEYVEQLGAQLERVSSAPTGWEAVVGYVSGLAEWMIADRSIAPIVRRMAEVDPTHRPADRFVPVIIAMVERAKAEGTLRADVDGIDLSAGAAMLGNLGLYGPAYEAHWRRQLGILLDGLRAEPGAATPLGADGPDVDVFHRMVHGIPE
ncbi:MAG: TetR/AcrR family transcriptional regulator, partial [Leifsonia sp.]